MIAQFTDTQEFWPSDRLFTVNSRRTGLSFIARIQSVQREPKSGKFLYIVQGVKGYANHIVTMAVEAYELKLCLTPPPTVYQSDLEAPLGIQ